MRFSRCLAIGFVSLLMAAPVAAQTPAPTAVPAAPRADVAVAKPPLSPEQQLDKLFAKLHQGPARDAENTMASIWTLWEHNDSPMAELLLGQSNKALQDGAFDTAETMLNTLLGSYPDFTEALNKRALVYYNQGRLDDALVDIDAVLEAEPRHFGALSGRAAILQAKGQSSQAAAALRDAIAVNPRMESAKDMLKLLEHDFPGI